MGKPAIEPKDCCRALKRTGSPGHEPLLPTGRYAAIQHQAVHDRRAIASLRRRKNPSAIDGKLNQYASVQVGEAAVFAFKDDKPMRFDTFGILISRSGRNPKELELLAGDDSPTGPFRSIGVFHPENVKLFKSGGWQDFRFPVVKARYVKVRFNSNFEDVVWIELVELRLLGAPS